MMRRTGITLLFVILGLICLLLSDTIDVKLCELFPEARHCSAGFHDCGLDCSQSWSVSRQIGAFIFFFGPSIEFGLAGFFYSKQPRRVLSWVYMIVGLWLVNSVAIIAAVHAAAG